MVADGEWRMGVDECGISWLQIIPPVQRPVTLSTALVRLTATNDL